MALLDEPAAAEDGSDAGSRGAPADDSDFQTVRLQTVLHSNAERQNGFNAEATMDDSPLQSDHEVLCACALSANIALGCSRPIWTFPAT